MSTSGSKQPEAGDYLLGSHDDELTRLAFQHRVWGEQAFALWRRARFGYGAEILDLGCGPGFTTVDLAHLVGPEGRVLAADSSRRFLDHLATQVRQAGLRNVTIMECDAHALELDPESLDGAYARWLFCYLRDPQSVVERVARALRPGAALAVTDYINYGAFTFAPRSEVFDRIVPAVEECWRRRGGNLDIQGRMPGIMQAAGLDVTLVRPLNRVAEPGSPLWNWPLTFFRNFLPTLEQAGLVGPGDRRALEREWAERGRDPATRLYLPPMADVVGVKR